ncbi:putative cytochrome P450 [Nocardia brasiliensis NBRC 14402]|uniref:cytochrome P450 n=1 Tax=Nocardia brasiliensis TaxID=37326 RepID=UPI00045CF768|nr:cytochrome P450 [Nocardia brasiliensis]ASF07031.1 cytochrome P450 [Nocardia brasiliensis]GAJ84489.1 putative cytochrome P450 [Nocardia brasiliensis NBRC 14402]SUB47717.1 Cytochrome P450 107B1 [Nocardia brasiliensis]
MNVPPSSEPGPLVHSSPTAADGPRIPLYSPEFAADPHRCYRDMRDRYGPLVPVLLAPQVPATLVIGYHTALRILNDPSRFPADPRLWQQHIPGDCPVLLQLGWRPTASRSAGPEFERYRQATTAGIDAIDLYALHDLVEQMAIPLINTFCTTGSANLLSQYVYPLVCQVINSLLGCPPEIGHRLMAGTTTVGDGMDVEAGNQIVFEALRELVALKRVEPGNDMTTVIMRHPAGLDEFELVNQVGQIYGTCIEILLHLIANTLLTIITDDRVGSGVVGGSLSVRGALDGVLFDDPPLANLLVSYPRQPILIDGVWLPAHQPVVISMAGCNNDPAIRTTDQIGNRAHLAWGVGPHACPAQSAAYLIAQDAIDQLLDALPDMRLDPEFGPPTWRTGPFYRALNALPVTFPRSAVLHI